MRRSAAAIALTTVALLATTMTGTAFAKGGSGGGGGGGNGGGGGGGGASVGSISQVGLGVPCDAGTVVSASFKKGFNKRVEVQLSLTGAPLTPTTNTLGGTWEFQVHNLTTGTRLGAMATTMSAGSAPPLITWLTSTVPVGASELKVTLTRRDQGSSLVPTPVATPVLETCTATAVVVGR